MMICNTVFYYEEILTYCADITKKVKENILLCVIQRNFMEDFFGLNNLLYKNINMISSVCLH